MVRELRDELEVSGHVVAVRLMSVAEVSVELRDILDDWESRGWSKLSDVPESPQKVRYFELLRVLRLKGDCL